MSFTPAAIPVERLTIGTWIKLPEFAWQVQVADISFDGSGYSLKVTDKDFRSVNETSWAEDAYIEAGQSVEFSGIGIPVLIAEQHVTIEEWAAIEAARATLTQEQAAA